ncbi:MAG: glycosyltransferase [Acidobacteriota bacterium]
MKLKTIRNAKPARQLALTIQIVGWNSARHLEVGVRALKAIPPQEVIIRYLDNGSSDNSIQIVRNTLPEADIIKLGKNIGFAQAHNRGIAMCATPFVLTHDPDVELNWQAVPKLLACLQRRHDVAAVQGKLLRKERGVIDSTGIILSLALNGKERGAGEVDVGQYEYPAVIDAVTGACGLYRIEALKRVAHGAQEFFDNDFFAYKEDVDLGWRFKRVGLRSMYQPVLMGYHSRTVGKRGVVPWFLNPLEFPPRLRSPRTYYSLRNYIWMVVKNKSVGQAFLHDWFIIPRLMYWFLLSLAYPPLLKAWIDAVRGIPKMIRKKNIGVPA